MGHIGGYTGITSNGDHLSALYLTVTGLEGEADNSLKPQSRTVTGSRGSIWTVKVYGEMTDQEILRAINGGIHVSQKAYTERHGRRTRGARRTRR